MRQTETTGSKESDLKKKITVKLTNGDSAAVNPPQLNDSRTQPGDRTTYSIQSAASPLH